jgi:hypothetical protein
MIKADPVPASVAEQGRKARAVLWIVHISATIHLKPVYAGLLWQTKHTLDGSEHRHPLLQLVKAQLHLIIHHPMITDATLIHIRIAFIIGDIMPQRHLVLRLYRPHIQSGIVRSRAKILLSPSILYDCHHTD